MLCGCSEFGSPSPSINICDPRSGQCVCNDNFSGLTCHEYEGQFYPQCNGIDYNNPNGEKYKHGSKVKLTCDDQSFKIENCEWKKNDGGPSCSAENGKRNSEIWENVKTKFSKKECSLTFETIELGHRGTYECELTSNKTEKRKSSSKFLRNFKKS